jgi:hypothetical protein
MHPAKAAFLLVRQAHQVLVPANKSGATLASEEELERRHAPFLPFEGENDACRPFPAPYTPL